MGRGRGLAKLLVLLWNLAIIMLLVLTALMAQILFTPAALEVSPLVGPMAVTVLAFGTIGVIAITLLDVFILLYGIEAVLRSQK